MKSFYKSRSEHYQEIAYEFNRKSIQFLMPFINEWTEKGYTVREIQCMLHESVNDACSKFIANRTYNKE